MDGCGSGAGRREGAAGGAARSEPGLPGAEEWPGAEEGALELNFLSPPWGWDLCCHLQGDAGCAAAGILMVWEACGGGLRAPRAPLRLWQLLRPSYFGEWEPPGLAGGGTGTSSHTLGNVGDPFPAIPVAGGGGGHCWAHLGLPLVATWGWLVFGDPPVFVEVALGHPPLQALPRDSRGSGLNHGAARRLNHKLPPSPRLLGWQEKGVSSPSPKTTFSKSAPLFWGKWGQFKIPCPRERSCRGESKAGDN